MRLSAVKVISAAVIQRLHWVDGSPPRCVTHVAGKFVLVFGRRPRLLFIYGSLPGMLEHPHGKGCWIPEAEQNSTLYDVTLKVICHHFF